MKTLKHKKTITKRSSFPYKVIGLVISSMGSTEQITCTHQNGDNIRVNDVTIKCAETNRSSKRLCVLL